MPSIITVLLTVSDKRPWGFWKMVSRMIGGVCLLPCLLSDLILPVGPVPDSATCDRNLTRSTRAFGIHSLLVFPLLRVTPSMPVLSHCSSDCFTPLSVPPWGCSCIGSAARVWALVLQEQRGSPGCREQKGVKQGHGTTSCRRGQTEYRRY